MKSGAAGDHEQARTRNPPRAARQIPEGSRDEIERNGLGEHQRQQQSGVYRSC